MWIVRRAAAGLVSLWLAITICFLCLRVLPGDAIQSLLVDSGAGQETIDARRAALGLDQPIEVQYAQTITGILRGDLGISILNGRPVTEILAQNLPHTFTLAVSAALVSVILGIAIGTLSAMNPFIAQIPQTVIALTLSVPIGWTATITIFIFAAQLNWLPSSGAGDLSQLILPALVLGFHTSGAIAAVFAAGLREFRQAGFAQAARGKGLRDVQLWRRHLVPNALTPTIPVIALQISFLLGGAVVTESIFSRPGVGRALLNAVLAQDYPVVQGLVVWMALVVVVLNLISDEVTHWIDPRVRAP